MKPITPPSGPQVAGLFIETYTKALENLGADNVDHAEIVTALVADLSHCFFAHFEDNQVVGKLMFEGICRGARERVVHNNGSSEYMLTVGEDREEFHTGTDASVSNYATKLHAATGLTVRVYRLHEERPFLVIASMGQEV